MSKKQLIEERNKLLEEMENMCGTKEQAEKQIRALGIENYEKIFKQKRTRVEQIDKELKKYRGIGATENMAKLIEFRSLDTTTGANFLENDVAQEVVKKIFEGEKVLEGIKVFNSINHTLDVVVETGIGADAVVVGEGQEGGIDDTIETKKVSFESERLTTTVNVTNKMLQDTSFDLDTYVSDILTRRLRRKLVDLVVNGTEDKKFIGLLNKTAMETNKLDYDALIDLIYTMPSDLDENNVVICHRNDFKKILKIKDLEGNPIVLTSVEDRGARYTILGHEIIVNDKVAEGKLIFANLSQAIGMLIKDGIKITRVAETDANLVRKGITQYTIDLYCDIKTLNEDAIEVLNVVA